LALAQKVPNEKCEKIGAKSLGRVNYQNQKYLQYGSL
jgi:hypothetical protein